MFFNSAFKSLDGFEGSCSAYEWYFKIFNFDSTYAFLNSTYECFDSAFPLHRAIVVCNSTFKWCNNA